MKLGSLFDGIGGFPLSGVRHGIEPVWASEIEPWPIKVTQHHFPNMKHLGDITKINGAEIEPVDIITFGSPCQDLSVAGKREGLEGQRSGLFMEAVRIIREMREATNGVYPRFAVWENVPGAYSSNGGQDFRAVLEEIAEAEIPMPTSGKWAEAGMVRTERVDVAWRTLDAQYWGVPQRRKRIFLVADFGGTSAAEVLFVEPRLSWNFETGGEAGQKITSPTRTGTQITMRNTTGTLRAEAGAAKHESDWESLVIQANEGDECYNLVIEPRSQDGVCRIHHDVVPTLNTAQGGQRQPCILEPIPIHDKATRYKGGGDTRNNDGAANGFGVGKPGDVMPTLGTTDRHAVATYWDGGQVSDCLDCSMLSKGQMMPDKRRFPAVIALDRASFNQGENAQYDFQILEDDTTSTLVSKGPSAVAKAPSYAVRRLTPTECLRLQGFPDWWLDIEGMSDTAKYKAVGNSVAVPCVEFVMAGIAGAGFQKKEGER